jgi:hypothetical protein
MKGKLTAEAVPAEGGIMSGYHAHVYRSGKGGKGQVTVYRSPHAYTSKDDAEAHARQWAEDNAEENE